MEEDYKSMRDAERHEDWERYGEYGPPRYVQILRFIPWVLSGLLVVGVIIYFFVEYGFRTGLFAFSAFGAVFYSIPVLSGYLFSSDHKGMRVFSGLVLPLIVLALFLASVFFFGF